MKFNVVNKHCFFIATKYSMAAAITTPIFLTVVYESVQSSISTENIGIMDLVNETWNRVIGYKYSYRTRMIPFW